MSKSAEESERMRTRLFALALAACLLLTVTASAQDGRFRDVEAGSWYEEAVYEAVERGLISGTYPDRFSPEDSATRAMLWVILFRLEGLSSTGRGAWYEDARQWSIRAGISDGSDPEGLLTREQFATFLYRYGRFKGYDLTTENDTLILSYHDAAKVSSFAVAPLQWACGEGIITGKPGDLLDPAGTAKRCEAAVILMRFLENTK